MDTNLPSIEKVIELLSSYPEIQRQGSAILNQGSEALLRGSFKGYAEACRRYACLMEGMDVPPSGPMPTEPIKVPHRAGTWAACATRDETIFDSNPNNATADFLFVSKVINDGDSGYPGEDSGDVSVDAYEHATRYCATSRLAKLESLLLAGGEECHEAAKANPEEPDMKVLLAVCQMNGWGCKASPATAWTQLAELSKGSPLAQYFIGVYAQKAGMKDAGKWIRLSAANGCWKAIAALKGDAQACNTAMKGWFELCRKFAEQGNAAAQDGLGDCYYCGEGVDKDMAKAVEWYRKAAEQGYAPAQNNLGDCYFFGFGVDEDEAKAAEWHRKAAEQGYAPAQYDLGNCYDDGLGVDEDEVKAAEWYRRAAEQGYAYAQDRLGDCYYNGEGVAQDYAKAVEWYRKAAEQGNAKAQNNLGDMYYDGKGVAQDYAKAVEWYRKAAAQGNVYAREVLQRFGES